MNLERGQIVLLNFTGLEKKLLEEILGWRNHEQIRKWMINSNPISLKDHFLFVEKLKGSKSSFYWLAQKKKNNLGTVYIHLNTNEIKTGEWGFYLAPGYLGTGVGLEIAFESIHLFFEHFNLDEITGIVKAENLENISLQEKFGYEFSIDSSSNNVFARLSKEEYLKISKDFNLFRKKLLNIK